MKKLKNVAATLLALAFLSPTATLFACDDNAAYALPTDGNAKETTPLPEGSAEEEAPQSEAPTDDEKPQAPTLPEPPVVQTAQYIRCTGNAVNIRAGAGTGHSVLGSAESGTMYAVIGKTGNWYKTYYRNQTAYIYAEYASVFSLEKTNEQDVEKVIAEGYKLLGVPYVYGAVRLHDGNGKLLKGFSVQKFDCSSLIQYIFYKGADKLLQVNTRTQIKQGRYVSPNELQRGDCIFFTNEQRQYNTGIERVGHVALYLGDNYILHTASDYARIEKISAKRWSFYVEARRFL